MKNILILFTLFFTHASIAQLSCDDTGIPGLTTVFPGHTRQMAGKYINDCGFTGVVYYLDVSGKYEHYYYSCDGKEPEDSGFWIPEGNQIALCGTGPVTYLDIFQIGDFYVLVPHESKADFITELKGALLKRDQLRDNADYVLYSIRLIVYVKKVDPDRMGISFLGGFR